LHHKAEIQSLPAVKENVFFTTNERKSMSKKLLIKRIALAAVSALGLGLVTSVSPANAAAVTTITPAYTSYTIVGSSGYAIVRYTVKDSLGAFDTLTGTETVTATIGQLPTQINSSTLVTAPTLTPVLANGTTCSAGAVVSAAGVPASGCANIADNGDSVVHYLKVAMAADSANRGEIPITLTSYVGSTFAGSVVIKFTLVSNTSLLDAPVVTLTSAATTVTAADNTAFGGTDDQLVTVTMADKNGGVITAGATATAASAFNTAPWLVPTVEMVWSSSATPAVAYETAASSIVDDGTLADEDANDNVWSVKWLAPLNAIGLLGAGRTHTIQAYYPGQTKVTKTLAVISVTSSSTLSHYALTATGSYAATAGSGATGGSYQIPLSTKSVTHSVYLGTSATAPLTGAATYYTVTYSGCVAADMTPTAATSVDAGTKVLTDANGLASVTITNANPITGCVATVNWTGGATNVSATTITWKVSTPTTVVSDPGGSYQALRLSTNKVTWTILDQYGAPVVGSTVTFTMTGANAPTAGLASQVSDAKGQVSYSWTDALSTGTATATTSDTVKINAVGTTTLAAGTVTVTYKATLDVVSSTNLTYTTSDVSAAVVPATAIGGATGRAISAADQLNTAKPITGATAAHFVLFTFTMLKSDGITAVSGIPATVTSTGGSILDGAGYLTTSRTIYGTTSFYAVGLKTGTQTITVTTGSLTKTATINWSNVYTDARVITLTDSAGTLTATVTDFNGNTVSGVLVDASAASGVKFGNAGNSTTFTTNSNGSVSFDATGSGVVTVSLGSSTYTKASFLANSGNATGTVVTTGAPAGVRSASVTTAGRVDQALAAAEAATDAAAEAIDAANAATDAANLAAEAADAATVAAEEARDAADAATAAVEELATQVATLMAALKAQITTLANTVAKIAKKVKA
jgi:hypothetical protein